MGAKFDKLESKLSGEKGVTDPAGLAASIGRKKYGKENYDKAAAKDKSPKMKKSDWEELEDMVEEVAKAKEKLEKVGVKASPNLWGKPSKPRGVGIYGKEGAAGGAGMKKSELDNEVDEMAKAMELSTIEPIAEIRKAVLELGPEGLRKAMPNMTDENKELLGEILEDMTKSHTLPLDAPKKLVNVGGENYVEEDVGNDDADEDIFDAAKKEGDNEQKHQGGSHDLTQPVDWEGQMIKSLDEFTAEELATFGEIYKAMKMKKKEDLEKVSASPKLWGSTKPRGVGIYKGEDDSVAEKVKEVEGKAKLNDVMDDTPDDKKDDVLKELRDKKMKKAKELIKAALKKECDMMEEKEEDVEVMKKKIKKALIMSLSEEYTDEEIAKAAKAMKKGDEERYKADEKYDKAEASEAYEGRDDAEKKGDEGKAAKYEKDIESDMDDADFDKDKAEGKKKFEKAMNLFAKSQELLDDGEKEIATELFLKAKKMVADVLEMNPGIKKLSQPEPANEAKTTADAVKSPKMAKSIKWYGEENDKFAAGKLGRHSYTSSVNSYYDEMIKKADSVVKEEELKKSFNPHNIEDLIEADLMKSQVEIQSDIQMEEFTKSQGNFTTNSFSDDDLIKSLNLSDEEVENCLGK